MVDFLRHLKTTTHDPSIRWIVKYKKNGKVREVKQIYNPSEYYRLNKEDSGENARPLHNKNVLLSILEKNKQAV